MDSKTEAKLRKQETVSYPFRQVLAGDSLQNVRQSLHVRADWALRDLARACVRTLYLIALERLARIVESLKRASRRVSAGGM